MRVIVHVGMHKTGSSSIQRYFHTAELPGLSYLRLGGPNHSRAFITLFDDMDQLLRNAGLNENGALDRATLEQKRSEGLERFAAQLRALQGTGATALVSAEQISALQFVNARARLHGFLRRFTGDLAVVGYVRSPVSFAVSAFQQRLRNPQPLREDALCVLPFYRERFEQIDDLFGRDRVQLVPFTPAALHRGDVVVDFARRIGATLPGDPPGRANESLSLEATALLYLHRTRGAGRLSGMAGATRINADFADALRGLGRSRFAFAPALWRPALRRRQADLDWMRARLGDPLQDRPPPAGTEIVASAAQLLDIADRQGPALEALVAGYLEGAPDALRRRGLPAAAGLRPRAHVLQLLALLGEAVRACHAARIAEDRGPRPEGGQQRNPEGGQQRNPEGGRQRRPQGVPGLPPRAGPGARPGRGPEGGPKGGGRLAPV